MKNLIIHPEDRSTNFLEPIYEKAEDPYVIRRESSSTQINNLLKRSDRILMMGHGSPHGLFSINMLKPEFKFMAIGKDEADLLKDKPENVYIWCNADKFVEYYNLKGFYSGMFISEVGEAYYCGLKGVTQAMVNESNDTFSQIVGKYINLPVEELYAKVKEEYGELAKTNPVAKYNHERLYLRK